MKEQVILFEFTTMKGIFFKKPDTKLLAFGVTMKDTFLILHLVGESQGKLISVLAAGWRTTDQEYADEIIDSIKYNAGNEILEILPSLTKIGSSKIVISLKKPSKYIGPRIVFNMDSRLPDGYYFTDIKVKKKDYQPMVNYKIDSDMGKLNAFKKLIGTKVAGITGNKLSASFRLK